MLITIYINAKIIEIGNERFYNQADWQAFVSYCWQMCHFGIFRLVPNASGIDSYRFRLVEK